MMYDNDLRNMLQESEIDISVFEGIEDAIALSQTGCVCMQPK